MKKITRMKKASVVAGIALAATVALSVTPGTARATYLGTPTVVYDAPGSTQPSGSSVVQTTTSTGTYNLYVTPTSTYGDTIPTPQAIDNALAAGGITGGTVETIGNNQSNTLPVFYDPTSLNTKLLNTLDTPFQAAANGVTTISGNILSNVYEVTSGSGTGDLVFTYQFNVTSVAVAGTGLNSGSITFFDQPLTAAGVGTPWIIGTGINTSILSPPLSGTITNLANLVSNVNYDTVVNNSIYQIGFDSSTYITAGDVSPQLFAASNAPDYTLGSLSIQGSGAGFNGLPVFVPSNAPEPGTLVLFGTALGLVAFMVVRNRRSQSVA